jgi:mannose-6-phosphate isomerase-like protein (cupin superfamily)
LVPTTIERQLLMTGDEIETAPDGSTVERLGRVSGGSMARFSFAAGSVSRAVRHRQVEEFWYVLSGEAELWRAEESGAAEVITLEAGTAFALPPRCAFQVRVSSETPLTVVAVTMPPWPGDEEAVFVDGHWH